MSRRKKILLGCLLVLLISQVPFAYRRYKLGRLHSTIQNINSARQPTTDDTGFTEYTGVLHVHSFLGGHSRGNFDQIIEAAKLNQLSFVVMTEHTAGNYNTAALTLKGMHGGVLFVNGNEVSLSNGDRFLVVPGDETFDGPSEETMTKASSRGALSIVAYPQDFRSWNANNYDGIEIYNVFTNAREINPVVMFFDGLWSYRGYPDLLFANFYSRPAANLQKWDRALASGKKLVALAGNDSHANVGVSLNDDSGKTLAGIHLDPYQRSFHLVRLHVLVSRDKPLNAENLLAALHQGHVFIGFDLLGDTIGFRFTASNGAETKVQGDEISFNAQVRLLVRIPVNGRVVLFQNGQAIEDRKGERKQEFSVTEKGVYRVEVYLPQLSKPLSEQPWIISNPIYVR